MGLRAKAMQRERKIRWQDTTKDSLPTNILSTAPLYAQHRLLARLSNTMQHISDKVGQQNAAPNLFSFGNSVYCYLLSLDIILGIRERKKAEL